VAYALRVDPTLASSNCRQRFAQVIQVEPLEELLTTEDFVIAMAPARRAR
jgi:hypothetical protein